MGTTFTAPKQSTQVYGLRVIAISDTHNGHAAIDIPPGDVLIHGGDYTNFSKIEQAHFFNEWLGTLPHKIKIVVNGNHESNARWKKNVKEIINNAIVLIDESIEIDTPGGEKLLIYGTNFCWPMEQGRNPVYDAIPDKTGILVSHGPALGYVDGNKGCRIFKQRCEEIANASGSKLKVVISGHIHQAYGTTMGSPFSCLSTVQFINASIAGNSRSPVNSAVIIDI